ncbi:MAG: Crp/Fnr family transcriptional regulator [Proteobacteria bacterium]|nr:MAG: Crp/Fnr family transcriptional regulator [Pseudomonadota bacterium]
MVPAGSDLVKQGGRPARSTLLLHGWASRYSTLVDGRRQMLALHIAGDFVDLHSYPLKVMDHSVGALTDCTTVSIPHERLRRLTEDDPHLGRVLWLMTLIDSAILRKWLLGAGQQTALEHAAHLYCELYTRLDIAGIAKPDHCFALPLSQAEFGDALGITPVHVSRTLSELRARNLLEWRRGKAQILDWPKLSRLAEFDPVYLSILDEPR